MALTNLLPNPNDPIAPPPIPNVAALSGNAPMPQFPGLKPLVQLDPNPIHQQIGRLTNQVNAYNNPAAPKTGFWNRIGHISAQIGNIAGDIAAPGTMARIPGTQMYNQNQENQRVRELAGLQGQDQAEQNNASKRGLEGAQGNEANARADALRNPEDKADKFTFQQTDHGLMRIDNVTGEAMPVTYNGQPLNPVAKPTEPKGMEHVPLLGADDKPMIANFHPDTGKYTDAAGNEIANPRPVPPPPNYGQMILPTKTATYLDAQGIPTEFQWNEQTKRYDIPVGQSATGGYGHEAAQAGAVERAGTELISDLQANKKDLGTLGAWVAKYGLNTPIADPKLAGIQAKLSSFAALNPAMHGSRGLHTMEHFEKLIGGLQQNPDASIAGIQGIIQTARAINPGANQGGGNEAPPAGAKVRDYTSLGGK